MAALYPLLLPMRQVARLLSLSLLVIFISSCASVNNHVIPKIKKAAISKVYSHELLQVDCPKKKAIVAIYPLAFFDGTGQRKSNSETSSFSTAVTPNPAPYLIRALAKTGLNNCGFFTVVERIGLENIAKERQLIRQTRTQFNEEDKLQPLIFAGLLMQGSVIGYESNVTSGGVGARYLGIGASKEYRSDTLTVSLRTVSVFSGRVLIEVLTTKTVLSVKNSQNVFKFVAYGTELIEVENGIVENESINVALQMAIEEAVLETVKEGYAKEFWDVKVD
jgi:curli production assembly/transport component CsgG